MTKAEICERINELGFIPAIPVSSAKGIWFAP
jgi:hypothetical protein